MNNHSKLPPSSAARRMACPGSRRMEVLYPRENSDASNEGTLAHEEAARCLQTGEISNNPDVKMYVDYVKHISKESHIHVEEKVIISSIHPDMWGTVDAWSSYSNGFHIFDFKYGFKPVEVFENWQLISYAAGVCMSNAILPRSEFTFHIVQPRDFNNPIKTWKISLDKLNDYWIRLINSEALAATEDAPLTPGIGCEYCAARHACPALRRNILEGIENMKELPEELNDEELGTELKSLHEFQDLLQSRITALEEETLAKLKLGKRIPFYQLGRSQPREKWVKPIKEVLILGDMFEVNLKKPDEAITPKQAIKAGVPADLVREYSETPLGELKLERIKESEIKQIFGGK